MNKPRYNYLKHKTNIDIWNHLIRGAVTTGEGCVEPIIGNRDKDGYHRIKVNGKQWRANRLSYICNWGQIPPGYFVCHSCDNPKCINPRHLWLGTGKDNAIDRDQKGRHRLADARLTRHLGESNGSAKLTEKDILEIRRLFIPSNKGNGHGANYDELARKFNVSKRSIAAIVRRKTWSHL
ncbi:HNH endonuclease [Rhodococcus qingshengii]|uniref:HNH endonuclease n=1 Tax=Rhodococcus qingshengii TaxID=334542 RepID=UPI00374D47E3